MDTSHSFLTLVIPTYWTRSRNQGIRDDDTYYDHPTPCDEEGTFMRTLKSTTVLQDQNFTILLVGSATNRDVERPMRSTIRRLLRTTPNAKKVVFVSKPELHLVKRSLLRRSRSAEADFLSLSGYSNVRNTCLIFAQLLRTDIAVMIDDDEVFEDPLFLSKVREGIGKTVGGETIWGLTGSCPEKNNSYLRIRPFHPYMASWNKIELQNQTFAKIIGKGKRYKISPFAFGGNLVLAKELFTKIPFDPVIERGEDMDYNLNVRLLGHTIFQDRTLAIKHLPPPRTHPVWKQIRQDLIRFFIQREKLREQESVFGNVRVTAESFDAYPGKFLSDQLEEKVFRASLALAKEYEEKNLFHDARESMWNTYLAYGGLRSSHPLQTLLRLQRRWKRLMATLDRCRPQLLSFLKLLPSFNRQGGG